MLLNGANKDRVNQEVLQARDGIEGKREERIEFTSSQAHSTEEAIAQQPPAARKRKTKRKKTLVEIFLSAVRWNKPIREVEKALGGMPINCSDPVNGNTCVHVAAQNGHFLLLQYLVDSKSADINAQNNNGHTPLHMYPRCLCVMYSLCISMYLLSGSSVIVCCVLYIGLLNLNFTNRLNGWWLMEQTNQS